LRDGSPLLKGFSQAAEHAGNFLRVTVKLAVFHLRQKALILGNRSLGNDLVDGTRGIADEAGIIGRWPGGTLGNIGGY
jgi:hypothetical protein